MNNRRASPDQKERKCDPHEKRRSGDQSMRRERGFSSGSRRKEEETCFIGGRNSVLESLRAGQVKKVFIKSGKKDSRLLALAEEAERFGISVIEAEERELDRLTEGVRHQGVAASLKPYAYADLEEVLSSCGRKDPLLILLDGVEDVRNIGAIVRTAECAGAAAVLLPKHRSSPVTAAAMKTAAGAFAYLPVCQIGNIRQTLEKLKERGFWAVGADMDGGDLYQADLKGPLVIVMGAEGKGISPLTKRMCDFCVRIPMKGKVSSLNVSVAAALLMYEAVRQRN